MYIKHKIINISGKDQIYIYIELEDRFEFGEEFLTSKEKHSFFNKLKGYITKKIEIQKDDAAVLIINGVLIGTLSLSIFTNPVYKELEISKTNTNNMKQKVAIDYLSKVKENKIKVLEITKEEEVIEEETVFKEKNISKAAILKDNTTETKNSPNTAEGIKVRLNSNGKIETMDLEDYVVGVVAAEMPASFHIEALKAQAVASRTFGLKKTTQGVILVNSTSHQVYKSETELRNMWGSSYGLNIAKIRNAVNYTKGLVITYNGSYIDALYHSMSNSRTEMPKYVWGSNLPYLQSVSSNWDTGVKGFETSINMDYTTLSNKLNQKITKDTDIKVLSETTGKRVENISIGKTTYSGVKIRAALGLRSADFKIIKEENGVKIITKGYGHGVGMSQNGANEAAKQGYSYERILKHYYTGISIIKS